MWTWILWCSPMFPEVKFRGMWKEIFLETQSVYFPEISTLGKTKWIKRKESIFLTGKNKCIPKANGCCLGRMFQCHFSGKVLWKENFFFPVFYFCTENSLWIVPNYLEYGYWLEKQWSLLKAILINIWESTSCNMNL